MSRGAHWNRNARRSGGDRRFRMGMPNIGAQMAALRLHLAQVRHEIGQSGVEAFIAEMRKRGDLECTDEQAQELATP